MKRTIAMFQCLKCGYHQGTPNYIKNKDSKKWKPKRCRMCGYKKLKFKYLVSI